MRFWRTFFNRVRTAGGPDFDVDKSVKMAEEIMEDDSLSWDQKATRLAIIAEKQREQLRKERGW